MTEPTSVPAARNRSTTAVAAGLGRPASKGPSSLRRDLLLRLRLDGPSSPDQLAERLGASRTGVLQQLRALEAAHLVSRQTVRHGVGRPRHLYDVTPDAQDLFPSNYDGLAAGLLAAIEAVGGDDLLEQVFAARRRQLGDRVREQMAERAGARRAAGRSGPRAGGHPGRPGLPRRRDRRAPTARSGCASTTARSTTSPQGRRPPARPSWSCSARSSAPTSSARQHIASGDRCCTYRITENRRRAPSRALACVGRVRDSLTHCRCASLPAPRPHLRLDVDLDAQFSIARLAARVLAELDDHGAGFAEVSGLERVAVDVHLGASDRGSGLPRERRGLTETARVATVEPSLGIVALE